MNVVHKSKDYNPKEHAEIITHINSLISLLKIETSKYCKINIRLSVDNGIISERIDSEIYHIHKLTHK